MTTASPALILENVRLPRQPSESALLNFSATVGEKILILGANGCGKTTLAEAICGYLMVATGKIGRCSHIGYVPQQPLLPGSLTVRQYFNQLATLCKNDADIEACINSFNLSQHTSRKINDLSRGWQQRINLAQAWLGNPQLLLLDEPQTALDPDGMSILKIAIEKTDAAVLVFAPANTGCEMLIDNHLNYNSLCSL
ncbi:MAG: ATP-binding cassette domain-containing protein [Planctomycetes bacterium]|nr:ATP-binding cassette domain-containing protein [Planctomycetota bacterium]